MASPRPNSYDDLSAQTLTLSFRSEIKNETTKMSTKKKQTLFGVINLSRINITGLSHRVSEITIRSAQNPSFQSRGPRMLRDEPHAPIAAYWNGDSQRGKVRNAIFRTCVQYPDFRVFVQEEPLRKVERPGEDHGRRKREAQDRERDSVFFYPDT